MQMILNELSARFPVDSVENAKQMMDSFLNTYVDVKKIINNDSMLLDQDYNSFELASGYRIEQWRNDSTVDVEDKRIFRTLLNKSTVYNSEEFEQEKEFDFRTEFLYKEHASKGCLLVYEMDGVAVSFLSSIHWRTPEIKGTYLMLSDDGELEHAQVEIPNVSFDGNIGEFKKYYEQWKEERRYKDIASAEDILKYAADTFPNLIFCGNAVQGCRKNVGVSEAGQVYKKLLELKRAAENMDSQFDKNCLAKASPESPVTLNRYSEEHTFSLPDGAMQLFSWHIRYTGGYAGRIFFHPVPEQKVIYIGHVGHKLPTVRYQ